MTVIDELFGAHKEKGISSEDELNLEKSGKVEKKPKTEISEDNTIAFTERERFWEGMK
ncbi:hypothetical protein [Butyrivibrio sp. WCD3002]|uniref:hypothetical protein n=1 Tax=Butyrivibrio sp. WCD3002 TaxID=1280676 RepID=UPI0004267524|nr:hypothetical protein [Butyrivibrio sp. WCD3002]